MSQIGKPKRETEYEPIIEPIPTEKPNKTPIPAQPTEEPVKVPV